MIEASSDTAAGAKLTMVDSAASVEPSPANSAAAPAAAAASSTVTALAAAATVTPASIHHCRGQLSIWSLTATRHAVLCSALTRRLRTPPAATTATVSATYVREGKLTGHMVFNCYQSCCNVQGTTAQPPRLFYR